MWTWLIWTNQLRQNSTGSKFLSFCLLSTSKCRLYASSKAEVKNPIKKLNTNSSRWIQINRNRTGYLRRLQKWIDFCWFKIQKLQEPASCCFILRLKKRACSANTWKEITHTDTHIRMSELAKKLIKNINQATMVI